MMELVSTIVRPCLNVNMSGGQAWNLGVLDNSTSQSVRSFSSIETGSYCGGDDDYNATVAFLHWF